MAPLLTRATTRSNDGVAGYQTIITVTVEIQLALIPAVRGIRVGQSIGIRQKSWQAWIASVVLGIFVIGVLGRGIMIRLKCPKLKNCLSYVRPRRLISKFPTDLQMLWTKDNA
jgi:hypothetical protein